MIGIILLYFLLAFYAINIYRIYIGWKSTPEIQLNKIENPISFSIIIPCRNEAENIAKCLASLSKLTFPKGSFEIIIVDDGSTDDLMQHVSPFIKNNIVFITSEGQGKKAALNAGIRVAKFPFTITLDADCTVSPQWLTAYASIIDQNPDARLIAGPVRIAQLSSSVVNDFQVMEMTANMTINANGIYRKEYYICNGANLCFDKQSFYEVNGYSGNENISSGDDVFLISKMSKAYPQAIFFIKNVLAAVDTTPMHTIHSLFSQRKRWASKTKAYASPRIIGIQGLVFLTNIFLLSTIIYGIANIHILKFALVAMILKMLVDYIYLTSATTYYQQKLRNFLPSFFMYMAYIIYLGTIALFSINYSWKERSGFGK